MSASLKGIIGELLTRLSCCRWRPVACSVQPACPHEGSNVDRHATEEQQEIDEDSPHANLRCMREKRNHNAHSTKCLYFVTSGGTCWVMQIQPFYIFVHSWGNNPIRQKSDWKTVESVFTQTPQCSKTHPEKVNCKSHSRVIRYLHYGLPGLLNILWFGSDHSNPKHANNILQISQYCSQWQKPVCAHNSIFFYSLGSSSQ